MIKEQKEIIQFFTFNNRTKLDSQRPVPEIESVNQLADENVLAMFENTTKEILDTDAGETALIGVRLLQNILLPQYPNMNQAEPLVYLRYQKIIGLLKFVNLSIYSLTEVNRLIHDYFVDILKSKLPITRKLNNVLEANDDAYLEGKVAQALTDAILACGQKVGESSLAKNNAKSVPQTLGNWLSDYIQYSVSSPEGSTGSMERIQYLKMNKNVSRLSEEDQKVLLRVFRIYDWLRYGGEDKEEDDQKAEAAAKYMSMDRFELPDEVGESDEVGDNVQPGFLGQKNEGTGRLFGAPSRLGPPPKAVNIQDVLKQEDGNKNLEFRSKEEDGEEEEKPGRPGLKLWEGGRNNNNNYNDNNNYNYNNNNNDNNQANKPSLIPNKISNAKLENPKPILPPSINKLNQSSVPAVSLPKPTSTSPSLRPPPPPASLDASRGGSLGERGKDKTMEIDKKLEELRKKLKNRP